ncbi:hypothetical protein [Bacillus phage BM-P1]|nr:hypothetical protein [Bacillus phage BM-P1]
MFPYNPDIICADTGDSGNYVEKLMAYFGPGRVYGVKVNPNTPVNRSSSACVVR